MGTTLAESSSANLEFVPPNHCKELIMNKDQVKGRATEAKGNVKEAAGKMVGNQRLQGEGLIDQAKGKTQGNYGDAKEKAKDLIDKA
jgi:uncharacterized protein YjbJ (UPF0337 family)